MRRKFFKKKYTGSEVEAYEVFLDSKNLPEFNTQQFEGRIETPISKRAIAFLGFFFVVILILFVGQLGVLQIKKGQAFYTKSENNSLNKKPLFANRGIIYDRNNVELAWNTLVPNTDFLHRSYIAESGFAHVLGYVSYPAKDTAGNYWQTEFVGKDGVEKKYNDILSGENGSSIYETDVSGKIQSENIVNQPKNGSNLNLAIDSRVEAQMYKNMHALSQSANYRGGAGVVMDITNGEIIALTSYPEYSPEILSTGSDQAKIKEYLQDSQKPLLNKVLYGLYTPGSIVKPFLAIGALNEGIIDPLKQILSTGSISIPNAYFPGKDTVFKDWKVNGWTDMRKAIAVSSDVYFYEIGGGYKDQKGLGITNIGKYATLFGIGQKTGVDLGNEKEGTIPDPDWKAKNFNGDPWRIGDTYHTAIGQYGFQVTPIQMVRAVAAIANNGTLVEPHILKDDIAANKNTTHIDLNPSFFQIAREGMRQTVTLGTAQSLNFSDIHVAVKTGTAQLGFNNERINSWVEGFYPYENPRYAFVILMESGPATNTLGATYVMHDTLDWMRLYTPEYFK